MFFIQTENLETFYSNLTNSDIENFLKIDTNRDLQNIKLPSQHKDRLLNGKNKFNALIITLLALATISLTSPGYAIIFSQFGQIASIAAGISTSVIPLAIAGVGAIITKKYYDRYMRKPISKVSKETIKNILIEDQKTLKNRRKELNLAMQNIDQILINYSCPTDSVFDDPRYFSLTP